MKRKLFILSILMAFLLIISACTAFEGTDNQSESMDITREYAGEGDSEEIEVAPEESQSLSAIDPLRVVTTIDLSFETINFDEFSNDIEDIIESNEGYIEYSDLWHGGSSEAYRRGDYTIRIPQENVNKFKERINDLGNILTESTNRQDVTSQYTDTESRLRAVETKEERILALLESADLMSDIIELEKELSNVIYEKEQLTSQLTDLDDRTNYSTLHLTVEEVTRYSNTEDIDDGLGTRIKNAITDSLHFFYTTLESLIIFFIYLIPFLIIMVIFIYFANKIYKNYKKK